MSKLTKDQLKQQLDAKGIKYTSKDDRKTLSDKLNVSEEVSSVSKNPVGGEY